MANFPDRLPQSQEIEAVAKEFASVPALRGFARQLREMRGGAVVANLKEHVFEEISPDALRANPKALGAVRQFLEKYPEAGAKVNFVHAPVHRLLLMAESPALGDKASKAGDLSKLDVPDPSIIWNLIEKGVKEKLGDWTNVDRIIEGITADNIWQMLEFAHKHQVENLEKACLGFLRKNKQLLKDVDQLSQYAVQRNMGRLLMILVKHCQKSNVEVPQSLKPFAEFAKKYDLRMLIKGSLKARVEDPQHLHEHPARIISIISI
ncbi:MAG: hypothetical protein LLG04_16820 [Parachlamydia sp.]|nr:hypothetical protein [Parachlamydia sp.]